MRTLLLTMIFIVWSVNIYACINTDITIVEDGHKKNIEFKHVAYTTRVNKEGYFDCNHLYVIDPISKLNILHQSDLMMNDFITDSIPVPKLPHKDFYIESNLSACRNYNAHMSVFSTEENIEFINSDIVSIERNRYFYGAGAAHGHNKVQHYVYNRKNGMRLSWDDLFEDKKIEKYILNRVINELASMEYIEFMRNDTNGFIQRFHGIDPKSVLMNFKKSGYFTIVNEGLKVQYNAYEIAPYAGGEPSLIVPKIILKKYMDEKVYNMCFSNKSSVKIIEECE